MNKVTDEMVSAALTFWCAKLPKATREQPVPDKLRDHMRATLEAALASPVQPGGETGDGWRTIDTARTDGTEYWVYVAPRDGLPGFQTRCAYHKDAGWCADELREVTHWWSELPPAPTAVLEDVPKAE